MAKEDFNAYFILHNETAKINQPRERAISLLPLLRGPAHAD